MFYQMISLGSGAREAVMSVADSPKWACQSDMGSLLAWSITYLQMSSLLSTTIAFSQRTSSVWMFLSSFSYYSLINDYCWAIISSRISIFYYCYWELSRASHFCFSLMNSIFLSRMLKNSPNSFIRIRSSILYYLPRPVRMKFLILLSTPGAWGIFEIMTE